MVGVAGKSKACHECRIRRLKCDLTRPTCRRCANAKVPCSGYQRQTIFVNSTQTSPKTRVVDAITRSKGVGPHISADEPNILIQKYEFISQAFTSGAYSTEEFRETAFYILRRLYLPQNEFAQDGAVAGSFSWVAAVCKCPQPSSTLDASLLAFCASQLYVTRTGSIDLDHAIRVYSDGLSILSTFLRAVEATRNLNGALASIVALSTCELFICPSSSGWRAHVNGIAEVIRLQEMLGEKSSNNYVELCARARVISVLTAMMSEGRGARVPSLQWRKILQGHVTQDPLGELLDIISDLSVVFELEDSPSYHMLTMLRLLEQVYAWKRTFTYREVGTPYRFISSQMHNPADDGYGTKLFPLVLEFRSLMFSSCLLVAWSAALHTLMMLCRVGRGCQKPDLQTLDSVWTLLDQKTYKGMDALKAIKVEADRLAHMLCQCVEYAHKPDMGCVGPQTMTYARWVLNRYFAQEGKMRELSWCRNITNMRKLGETGHCIRLEDFHT